MSRTERARNLDALHEWLSDPTRAFDWERLDCIRFAARAVRLQSDVNPLKGVTPWRSQLGAGRELAKRGGMIEAVSSRLTEIASAFAKRGDIALVENMGVAAIMVVEGETLVGPGVGGLIRLPRSAMVVAWDAMSASVPE